LSGQASEPQQGHQRHWDRIDARARAREEAQDGLHRPPCCVKDQTLTLNFSALRADEKSSHERTRQDASKGQRVLARTVNAVHTLTCAFVYVFSNLYCDMILFGGSLHYSVCGQAQRHLLHWNWIDACARAWEEA